MSFSVFVKTSCASIRHLLTRAWFAHACEWIILVGACCTCSALWIAFHRACSLLFPPLLFSTIAIALNMVVLSPLVFFVGSWFCSSFLFIFCSFFGAIKAIFTFGFVLTFISVFSAMVVHIWVYHCSCFFAWQLFEFSDLLKFGALLTHLGCAISDEPYQIAFNGDHFSWFLF